MGLSILWFCHLWATWTRQHLIIISSLFIVSAFFLSNMSRYRWWQTAIASILFIIYLFALPLLFPNEEKETSQLKQVFLWAILFVFFIAVVRAHDQQGVAPVAAFCNVADLSLSMVTRARACANRSPFVRLLRTIAKGSCQQLKETQSIVFLPRLLTMEPIVMLQLSQLLLVVLHLPLLSHLGLRLGLDLCLIGRTC